jgi:hypothetical protein
MTLQPREADYDIELLDGGVHVMFRPTASEFVYQQLPILMILPGKVRCRDRRMCVTPGQATKGAMTKEKSKPLRSNWLPKPSAALFKRPQIPRGNRGIR